jgi:isopenicillin N synthase-like dioxygenase
MEKFAKRPIIQMKLIRYPPQNMARAGQFGIGPHTDFGGVTVLLQQPNGHGLEVWHEKKNEWVEIPAIEDVFVINVGDMLQRWSGGIYKSAKHRVINKTTESNGERISIATFWHGDVEATNPFNPNDQSKDTVGSLLVKRFGKQYSLDITAEAVQVS